MFFSLRFGVSLLAFVGIGATAFQLDQPHATPINKHFDANGWTPLPTSNPEPVIELFKRQADPALCGYLQGDSEHPLTCGESSSCLRNPSLSWFGCCTGTSITDCQVYTRCVESRSVSACLTRSDCANDRLAMACTSSASPSCATLYKTVSGAAYRHFVCASKGTSIKVLSTPTRSGSSSSRGSSSSSRNSTSSATRSGSGTPTTRTASSTSSGGRSNSTAVQSTGTISMTITAQATSSGENEQTSAHGQLTSQSIVGGPSQSSSSAQAGRTAEVVGGVVGGIAGILALVV